MAEETNQIAADAQQAVNPAPVVAEPAPVNPAVAAAAPHPAHAILTEIEHVAESCIGTTARTLQLLVAKARELL